MAKEKPKYTPTIQQYLDIQDEYPHAIVAYEQGKFYEFYEVDKKGSAAKVSQLLDMVLTKKNKSVENSPLMVGFPFIKGDFYFERLVNAGETVVVIEQNIRGPKSEGNKKITRKVTKILSPGITLDQLSESRNNYFASIFVDGNHVGICLIDISTGQVKVTEMQTLEAQNFIDKVKPREILVSGKSDISFSENVLLVHENSEKHLISKINQAAKILGDIYELKNPTSNQTLSIVQLGLETLREGTLALANLVNYLSVTEFNNLLLRKIGLPVIMDAEKFLKISQSGLMALDIVESASSNPAQNTLVGILDRCKTAMGKRELRNWVLNPLTDLSEITARHDEVQRFIDEKRFFEELKNVYDISRITRRMLLGNLLPHEMGNMFQSLTIIKGILEQEKSSLSKRAKEILSYISKHIDVQEAMISSAETSDYTFLIGELRERLNTQFVHWKTSEQAVMDYKETLEKELDNKLRIVEKMESMQLIGSKGMAKVAQSKKIRVQIKENSAEITDEKWERIAFECFGNKQKYVISAKKEWQAFQKEFVNRFGPIIISICDEIVKVDILSTFAEISLERGYSRPIFLEEENARVDLKNMRHPMVELSTRLTERFVANDIHLDEGKKTLAIYGANSAGKSTILKSIAINVIMAQIGCFIACEEGSKMTVMENVLTRISSHDSLSEGLSTFTLEMTELQVSLKYIGQRSLFLFDEIGRGTSVEDGEALAYGVLAFLDKDENKSLTFFATHYHELAIPVSKEIKSVEINHVHCETNHKNELIFSRKLMPGAGSGSYGIAVAKSCGLDLEIIKLAENYNKNYAPLKKSHYNANVFGTICPICNENPVQETHHLVEQKQGKVKEIHDHGAIRSINSVSNLIYICASCHEKITRGEITVDRRTSTGGDFLEIKRR